MKILGFSGKKCSGKNTAANWLAVNTLNYIGFDAKLNNFGQIEVVSVDKDGQIANGILDITSRDKSIINFLQHEVWPYLKIYSFATILKDFCIDVLGLSKTQCYGTDEDKNTLTHLKWEDMPGVLNEEDVKPKSVQKYLEANKLSVHSCGQMTAREVLQFFGTNICRRMYDNVWVDALVRQIQSEGVATAIISDIRFPNEVEGIQKIGGKVIRLLRDPYENTDRHNSELALDNYTGFDNVIDNSKMSIAEQCDAITAVLKDWQW